MSILIANLTVPQGATIINVIITVLQYSLGLALVALLLYLLPHSNSANTWNVAARQVHTSLWPIILRCAPPNANTRVEFFSKLSVISALLVAICGIVTPLGMKDGPAIPSSYRTLDASFVDDNSPLGLATSPRGEFKFSRTCGAFVNIPCPGYTPETINNTDIHPSIIERFSSTPHGPFNMQFRRYYTSRDLRANLTRAQIGVVQSMVLRNDIFAAAGVIIDMSDSPGIGFLNHTAPLIKEGATWSQETLWLEPVTTCVNTNLTLDYILVDDYNDFRVTQFNLTDRGGFVNLTTVNSPISRDGQNVNLYERAYRGAVLSNRYALLAFNNMTRDQSYIGRTYPLNTTTTSFRLGEMSVTDVKYLANATSISLETACRGFAGGDNTNISTINVQCGLFTGPPKRTDGRDERIPSFDSLWSQTLHVCASATRASIQTVTFSTNSSTNLRNLQIVRKPSTTPVLWAMENANMTIGELDPFWGRVADKYESDPSLWTIRSNRFYIPAGSVDMLGVTTTGQPSTIPGAAWSQVYATTTTGLSGLDYSGKNNFALLTKWQTLLGTSPELGHAQIRNLIWTDVVANSLVGLETHSKLLVANLRPSVAYDLRYGIPLLIALIIWVPSCIASTTIITLGLLKISYIRNLVNHTAVGRLALGHSALTTDDNAPKDSEVVHLNEKEWQQTAGKTLISFHPVDVRQRNKEAIYNGVADESHDPRARI